jgi:soluble P-type ATPase
MITLNIPGYKKEELQLKILVLDFNGTIAIDGKLINGVDERLIVLSEKLEIHVLTGNSYGNAEKELKGLPCSVISLSERNQGLDKGKYIDTLDKDKVISIGNGRNDSQMFQHSAIGIIVIQQEGASTNSLLVADIVCNTIFDALDLLDHPNRMKSTLRS